MGRSAGILGILAAGLLATAVQAQSRPRISVDLSQETPQVGTPFEIHIAVTAEGSEDPKITWPDVPGLRILQRRFSQPSSAFSFSFSFGTGRGAQQIVKKAGTWRIDLVAVADRPGNFTFGPVTVRLDGRTHVGAKIPFAVVAAGTAPDRQPGAPPPTSGQLTADQLAGAKIHPKFFVHMIPSRTQVYQGQLVILDVYIFTTVENLQVERMEKEPGTVGFWVEQFEDLDPRSVPNTQVVINDRVYERALLRRLALFPLKTGKLTIEGAQLVVNEATMGLLGLFPGRSYRLTAAPVTIDVLPLPDPPAGFDPANVGSYRLFVSAEPTTVRVGQAVTVTVTVKGQGNVRNVVLPQVPEIPGCKRYPPESTTQVSAQRNAVSGMRQDTVILIPQQAGTCTIPALEWTYFDPERRAYRTEKSAPVTITATGAAAGGAATAPGAQRPAASQPSAPQDAVARVNADLRTIRTDEDIAFSAPLPARTAWFWLAVLAFPGLWVTRRTWEAVRARRRAARRRPQAHAAQAKKRLRALRDARDMDQETLYATAHKILLAYLESRLGPAVHGDTLPQLRDRLVRCGADEDLAHAVGECIESLEFARFAKVDAPGVTADIDRVAALIDRLAAARLTASEEVSR